MPYEWEEWALRALLGIEPYAVRQVLEATHRWLGARDLTESELADLARWEKTR
jgi:hypothetical protein